MLVDVSGSHAEDDESTNESALPSRDAKVTRNPTKSNNESITFRVYSDAMDRLRKEAGEKDISVNTLVNQLLRGHVEWHSIAAKAGFISVRKGFVKTMIDKFSDQEVKMLAEHIARTSNRDMLMIFRNKISIDCAVDFVESWLRASGFAYRHESKAIGTHSFVIQHDMGRKWSLYLAELYRHLFEQCKATRFVYDARDSTMSFVLEGQLRA